MNSAHVLTAEKTASRRKDVRNEYFNRRERFQQRALSLTTEATHLTYASKMAPARVDSGAPDTEWPQTAHTEPYEKYEGPPRNIKYINDLELDPKLQPKAYEITGTHPDSRILFTNVNILDSTGKEPYKGDVLIEGKS